MRVLRKAEQKPELKEKLDQLEDLWGVQPKTLHKHLHDLGPRQAAQFINQHAGLVNQLNEVKAILGTEYKPLISDHKDEIKECMQSYGKHQRPEDYLDSFNQFIREQIDQSAALVVVVNKPHDLTRQQLKDIRLLLDGAGFSEANLQTAYRNQTNHDIAASIIGHIRRAALGEALISLEQRVAQAMRTIYSNHNWNVAQRKWLDTTDS